MIARILTLFIAAVGAAAPASVAQQSAAPLSFDSNGVRIQYVDRGKGSPVLLLHGYTGSYARHFEAPGVMDSLEKAGYRVIAMDCRGHGQSDKPQEPSQYGLEMVRDVTRLLEHLKIARTHIVGYSMGGAIATQLVVKQPALLQTVTLIGAGWEGEDLSVLRSQMTALANGFEKGDASPLIRAVTASGQTGPTDEEIAALNKSLFSRNDPKALAAAARSMASLFEISRAGLSATTVPMLAIVGEHDENRAAVTRMAGVVRGLEVVVLPGATHATSVRPSAEPLLAFLNKHRN